MKACLAIGLVVVFGNSFAEETIKPGALPLYSKSDLNQGGELQAPLEAFVTLVGQQDWANARMLADELIEELEGLPRFDLYYGVLLMQERAFDLAIFPLERVLTFQPDQHRARLELGRAYYMLANFERAKTELNQVLAINPPSSVKAKVNEILDAINKAQQQAEISHVVGVSVMAGCDNNVNGGSSLKEALDPNLLNLTELSSDSAPIETAFGQWSVNYALIRPISQTGSQRLLLDYTNKIYTEPNIPNSHTFTLGGYVVDQQAKRRSTLPVTAQLGLTGNTLTQLTFDASYQYDWLIWGPLWTGVKIGTQPSISLVESTPTSVKDMAGITLSASERGRVHTFQSLYLQISLSGQDDEHTEWRGLANSYSLTWPINPSMNLSSQFEHQWRVYKAEDLLFTIDDQSTELKTRQDQVVSLKSQFNWQANPWLKSQTRVSFEWVESNINAYGRNRLTVSQALSVQF
jgi:tetratricopeptide (TPR) repeat protein